jgi:AcrR family transcriptional regulator
MPDESIPKISKKQQQIIDTAEELFFRHGMKRITIEEICRKARVSKMTFYKYFADKIELAKYIWLTWIEEMLAKLDEFEAMDISFPEKFQRVFEYSLNLMSKMNTEFVKDSMVLIERDHLEQVKSMPRLRQIIIDAQKRGEIRPEIRLEFLLAMHDKFHELLRDENLLKLYPDYAAFSKEIFNFFCYGILTRPQ